MKNDYSLMRGLIVGCGSIGERHLHNLQKLGIKEITICDVDKKRVDYLGRKYGVQKCYSLEDALSNEPDFSLVCTYPTSHVEIAENCINANSHVFIEKPISSNFKGVIRLLKNAQSKKKKIAVGYNLRFDEGLNLLRKKIQSLEISKPLIALAEWGHNIKFWRPGTNYKNHYVLKKGGGIILDDSHEYDYLRWIFGDEIKSVYCKTVKMSSIKTETESVASMFLKFKKGTIANLTIDYVRPKYERNCHVIGEKGDLTWRYIPIKSGWKNYDAKALSIVGANFVKRKSKEQKLEIKSNQMYILEIENFLNCITNDQKPLVDGWEGLKTLKVGMAALESAKKDKPIRL